LPSITNPITGQRLLLESAALVDQPGLGVISVGGEGRLEWLHTLLSQNVRNLQPGQSVEALALDANGHLEHILRLQDDGEQTWAIVERSGADSLLDWLRKMIFRSKVTVRDSLAEFRVIASWDSPLRQVVPSVSWTDGWSATAAGGFRYGAEPSEPWKLVLNVVTARQADELATDAEVNWATQDALDALRIAAHRPAWAEVDEKTIPHELDFLASAVHLSKGCYRGQETVAKVHNLGHPPRRLVMLHLDGSTHIHPQAGSEVVLMEDLQSGSPVAKGRVTSVAQHHEMGPIALAVISRNVPLEQALAVIGENEPVAASQEVIVPLDAGKVANIPRPSLLGRPRG
jgi:hypothetical protein